MLAQAAVRYTGQGPQVKLLGCWVLSVGQYGPATKLFLRFVFRSATLVSMGPRLNYLGISFSAIFVMKVFRLFVLCGSGRQGSTMNINFRTFVLSIDDHPFQSETANDSTTYITSVDATATRKERKCDPSKRVCLCGHYSL